MKSAILDSYKYGDRIGAPWESQDYGLHNRSYEEIMVRANNYPDGTDESDIVDCFFEFTKGYTCSSIDKLITDWLVFQTKNRHNRRYGGTYRNHFRLMESLISKGKVDLDVIRKISKGSKPGGSFGNGCLVLVYPVYYYAKQIREDSENLVVAFTETIYAHDLAIRAVRFLTQIIKAAENLKDIRAINTEDDYVREFLSTGLDFSPDEYILKYPENVMALHTLFNALYCAYNANDSKDVITRCVNFGGDVDSVLSTSMMIFALKEANSGAISK